MKDWVFNFIDARTSARTLKRVLTLRASITPRYVTHFDGSLWVTPERMTVGHAIGRYDSKVSLAHLIDDLQGVKT